MRPAKAQISLGVRPVRSESSLCAWWVKEPVLLHADSEDSDQTGWMPRLIWVFSGRTDHFVGFVVRWLRFIEVAAHQALPALDKSWILSWIQGKMLDCYGYHRPALNSFGMRCCWTNITSQNSAKPKKMIKMYSTYTETSAQPAHQYRLIRVFVARLFADQMT